MLYNEAIDEEINPQHGDCIELPSRADALQAFVGSAKTNGSHKTLKPVTFTQRDKKAGMEGKRKPS
jgi:hypothetical protein